MFDGYVQQYNNSNYGETTLIKVDPLFMDGCSFMNGFPSTGG